MHMNDHREKLSSAYCLGIIYRNLTKLADAHLQSIAERVPMRRSRLMQWLRSTMGANAKIIYDMRSLEYFEKHPASLLSAYAKKSSKSAVSVEDTLICLRIWSGRQEALEPSHPIWNDIYHISEHDDMLTALILVLALDAKNLKGIRKEPAYWKSVVERWIDYPDILFLWFMLAESAHCSDIDEDVVQLIAKQESSWRFWDRLLIQCSWGTLEYDSMREIQWIHGECQDWVGLSDEEAQAMMCTHLMALDTSSVPSSYNYEQAFMAMRSYAEDRPSHIAHLSSKVRMELASYAFDTDSWRQALQKEKDLSVILELVDRQVFMPPAQLAIHILRATDSCSQLFPIRRAFNTINRLMGIDVSASEVIAWELLQRLHISSSDDTVRYDCRSWCLGVLANYADTQPPMSPDLAWEIMTQKISVESIISNTSFSWDPLRMKRCGEFLETLQEENVFLPYARLLWKARPEAEHTESDIIEGLQCPDSRVRLMWEKKLALECDREVENSEYDEWL